MASLTYARDDEMMTYGTFGSDPKRHARTMARFELYCGASAVEHTSSAGCWSWTGQTNQKGYGRLWNGDRLVLAHRFSFEAHIGPVPDGLEVGHLCRNRRCVNPAHLQAMTHAQIMRMRAEREGMPCIALGRPMTQKERNARYLARRKAQADRDRAESGWWVEI